VVDGVLVEAAGGDVVFLGGGAATLWAALATPKSLEQLIDGIDGGSAAEIGETVADLERLGAVERLP
jgi:hypothetical protein